MYKKLLLYFFYVITIINFLACTSSSKEKVLPFLGNPDVEYHSVNGQEIADTMYPKMIPFKFFNEDSIQVTDKKFKNKVWVADFFFTSCPTICPKMTKNMKKLQNNLKDLSKDIQFLSFTINPSFDTPSILKRYKKHHHINVENWTFLNGSEAYTNDLGINHFLLFGHPDSTSAGGYAHSPSFSLVDKDGFVRGVYNGTETKEIIRLEKDIRKLLKYEYGITRSN